jgi:hypothetical protein
MVAHFHVGRHEFVEKCWNLAEAEALHFATRPDVRLPFSDSQTKATASDTEGSPTNKESPKLTHYRSRILNRPLTTYLRSLAAVKAYHKMTGVMDRLIELGFDLNYSAWNTYIQMLLRGNQQLTAFLACETKLMQKWPGWNPSPSESDTQHDRPRTYVAGFSYMSHQKHQPTTYGPTYRTIVLLAAVVKDLRRRKEQGARAAGVELARIHIKAPKTMGAIITMPHVKDGLQGRFLKS